MIDDMRCCRLCFCQSWQFWYNMFRWPLRREKSESTKVVFESWPLPKYTWARFNLAKSNFWTFQEIRHAARSKSPKVRVEKSSTDTALWRDTSTAGDLGKWDYCRTEPRAFLIKQPYAVIWKSFFIFRFFGAQRTDTNDHTIFFHTPAILWLLLFR